MEILEEHRALRSESGPSDLVFVNRYGDMYTDYGLSKVARYVWEKAGLLEDRPGTKVLHDLRATAASFMVDAGASSETLRSNLGWKSREVVDRYVKAFERSRREAHRNLWTVRIACALLKLALAAITQTTAPRPSAEDQRLQRLGAHLEARWRELSEKERLQLEKLLGLEPADRTARAVERQLRAMGCSVFEIGIREASTGRMMSRTWSIEQAMENLAALRRMNAHRNDIFVRPAERTGHGLVPLDDLKPAALARMERDGRSPAAVIETAPGNYQAWVRVPSRASEGARGEIARRLAHEYGADRASASSHHYGRLAGFANQKQVHRTREGLQPFALVRRASGRVGDRPGATSPPRSSWLRRDSPHARSSGPCARPARISRSARAGSGRPICPRHNTRGARRARPPA